MLLYLIRHAKDNDSIRGGWSRHSLTEEGHKQAQRLAEYMKTGNDSFQIGAVFSSDLPRAMETAEEIAKQLKLPVEALAEFREVNNGDLAGMDNEIAAERYPEFYWNQMDWTQAYPNGESPAEFYERISRAWSALSECLLKQPQNCVLVTHGGVIQVILSLICHKPYSNTKPLRKIKNCEIIILKYDKNHWSE